jgi:RHS repeat-associated protein
VGLKRYRYTGKERDGENAFYYHGARYYAPWLGRWVSCDPAGPRDALSAFVYVRCNPVRLIDPNGRWSVDWGAVAEGVAVGIGVAIVGAVVIAAVAATGGLAVGAIAAAAGASATTAATAAEFTAGAVLVGAALYGGVQTGKKVVNVATGHDYDTNKPLTDSERSRQAGGLAVDVAALAFAAKEIPAARADARAPAEMLDTLTEARAAKPDTKARGNATLGQAEAGGQRTPVMESKPGEKGTNTNHPDMTAPPIARAAAGPNDGVTVVLDQVPCEHCDPALEAGLPPGSKVVVPRRAGGPAPPRSVEPNPTKISVKTWSEQAARGEIKVEPYTLFKTPKSFGQHFSDAPKGPLAPVPGNIFDSRPDDADKNKATYQLEVRF